jgi:RND family efflux transporter MFP subunit
MKPHTQTDEPSLLGQLRIDRADDDAGTPAAPRHAARRWMIGAVAVTAIVGSYWFLRAEPETAHPEAAATAAPTGAPPAEPAATSPNSQLDASGYVVARRRATVSAKVTGKVSEVLIEEGRRVESGEIIARLDDSNYRAAVEQASANVAESEANLAAAQTAFADSQPIFQRNEKQQAAGVISAQAFDAAKAAYNSGRAATTVAQRQVDSAKAGLSIARRNLEDTVIRAPFSGVVTEKAAQIGEIVSPMSAGGGFTRTGIGTIVDMDSLEVEVDVSENFINRVHAKQPVIVKLNAYSDWTIPGEVIATIPTADRAKATVKVRIALGKKDARVLPEMGARVSFLSADAGSRKVPTDNPDIAVPANVIASAAVSPR